MAESTGFISLLKTGWAAGGKALRALVYAMAIVSGLSVLAIMLVTCADVILRLRWVNHPFIGPTTSSRSSGR